MLYTFLEGSLFGGAGGTSPLFLLSGATQKKKIILNF